MTTFRKAMPLLLLCAALLVCLPLAAQNNPDCSFTHQFTGNDATWAGVSNLSNNTPCVNWRVTFSATATLTTQVTFQTSPDGITWTSVPNTICSAGVQPPCIIQGTNPTASGAQGMIYLSLYGNYVRVITSGSAGTGTATVRGYGAKGASANALPQLAPGGVIAGLTTGTIPEATSPTSLGDSPITDNGTTITVGGSRNLAVGTTIPVGAQLNSMGAAGDIFSGGSIVADSAGGITKGGGMVMTDNDQTTASAQGYLMSNWAYNATDVYARNGGSSLDIFSIGTSVSEGLSPGDRAFLLAPAGVAGAHIVWANALQLYQADLSAKFAGLIRVGGLTASFPALGNDAGTLKVQTADGLATLAPVEASKISIPTFTQTTAGTIFSTNTGTLTQADITSLSTVPITLVAAQGAGTFIVLDSFSFEILPTTTPYALGGPLGIRYGTIATSPGTLSGGNCPAAMINLNNLKAICFGPGAGNYWTGTTGINQPLILDNETAAFTCAGTCGTGKWWVSYHVITGVQ